MFYRTNPIIMCTFLKEKMCFVLGLLVCLVGVIWWGILLLVVFIFIAILRLSVLLGGRSKLWLNPADDSLADLRIFQILKYMSGFLKTPQNFKNTRLVSPFPR